MTAGGGRDTDRPGIAANRPGPVVRWKRRLDRLLGFARYDVLVDITNTCNMRCIFCPRAREEPAFMSTAAFAALLADLSGRIGSLQLSCAWEYSVAPNAAEVLRLLGAAAIPHTSIYTNAKVLTDELADAVIAARLTDFVVSIGEARRETYERIRRGGRFAQVIGNIGKLARRKREQGSRHPRLCANLTVIKSNLPELPEFVELAGSLGIEEIRGRHLILNEGLAMEDERIVDHGRANAVLAEAAGRAAALGIAFDVPPYEASPPPKACAAPWRQLYVASNGDVSVCPRIHRHVAAGNLLREGIRGIERSAALRQLRREFEAGAFTNPVCAVCLANRETEVAIDQGF
jgi:MoaA/NifB/PqqE/SkfB family radical SAM enzyme